MQWKYRKRMLICDDVFNEIIISNAQAKALFKKYKKALFIRYTTEVDRTDSTEWYCCIKDDRYDFECLKSKRKNVIRKGLSNFSVREVKLSDYVDDLYVLINDAYSGYDNAQSITFEQAKQKAEEISREKSTFVLGAFANDSEHLVGYLWCYIIDNCITLSEQKVIREYEHNGINAALLWELCQRYNEQYVDDGYYLLDGWKNILHNTNFQDYLVKYFGFRKAYSNLHIIYNPRYAWWLRPMLAFYPVYKGVLRKISPSMYGQITAIKKLQVAARG